MSDTESLLADWKAKTDAATEGPWTWDGDSFDDADQESCPHGTEWTDHGPDLRAAGEGVITSWGYDASGLRIETADAEFIAMSRTAVPKLLAAVEGVLGLHHRADYVPHDHYFYGERTPVAVCAHCTQIIEDTDTEGGYSAPQWQEWPCATVRAITDALGGGNDD